MEVRMADTKTGQKTTICGANRCLTIKMKIKMKKTLLMVAAVTMMAFTACNKENIIGGNEVETPTEDSVVSPVSVVEFTASFGATKTALDKAGEKTLWVTSDEISINDQKFAIKELIDGGAAAKFVNVNELPDDFAAPFTAKYPYGVEGIPSTQQATPGTFDPNAALEIAESEDHNLSFTNVASLLKFQVPSACEIVTISSDEVLAGSDATTVTVEGEFSPEEIYYAAVLPGIKTNFEVLIDGNLSRSAASVTIGESTIANMGTLPEPTTPVYMRPSNDWDTNAESFGAYVWIDDDNNNWFEMTDSNDDGVYEAEIPVKYQNVIFVAQTAKFVADWKNKYGQTANLIVPTDANNAFVVYLGEWKVLSEAVSYVEPQNIKLVIKVNKSINWWDKYIYSWYYEGSTKKEPTGGWPGVKAEYIKEEGNYYLYYHNFDLSLTGKTISYIVNGNGSGQTKDLTVKLAAPETVVTIESSNLK